jgi:hypothetical protein
MHIFISIEQNRQCVSQNGDKSGDMSIWLSNIDTRPSHFHGRRTDLRIGKSFH